MEIPFYAQEVFASFTTKERQSLYQLMCGMMMVDGNADPRERQVINKVGQAMHLTQNDIVASRTLSRDFMISTLRNMPDEKRCLVARAISSIALADGKVVPIEDNFAGMIAKELKLDLNWF